MIKDISDQCISCRASVECSKCGHCDYCDGMKIRQQDAEIKRLTEQLKATEDNEDALVNCNKKLMKENKHLRELLRSSACPICDSDLVLENEFHCAYCEEVDKVLEEV